MVQGLLLFNEITLKIQFNLLIKKSIAKIALSFLKISQFQVYMQISSLII